MRAARVGQLVDGVHFRRRQRNRRRRHPQLAVAVTLDEWPGVAGVGLAVQHAGGTRVSLGVGCDLLVGGQSDHDLRIAQHARAFIGTVDVVRTLLDETVGYGGFHHRDAADVVPVRDRAAPGEAMRDLHDGALGVTVDQQVGLRVDEHRAADLVRPVVVVGDAAQRGLDAADDDAGVLEGFPAALGVDDDGAIRSLAPGTAWRVRIVVADAAVRGVAVHHGVHVAAGDAEEQRRLAERLERIGTLPIRLCQDADAEALRLQQPADDRHAEARVVDIGVAGDQDDVAFVPAERVHLRPRHRQEGCRAVPVRPEFTMGEQRLGRRKWRGGFGSGLGGSGHGAQDVVWAQLER